MEELFAVLIDDVASHSECCSAVSASSRTLSSLQTLVIARKQDGTRQARSIDLMAVFGGGGFIGAQYYERRKEAASSIPVGRDVGTTKLSQTEFMWVTLLTQRHTKTC